MNILEFLQDLFLTPLINENLRIDYLIAGLILAATLSFLISLVYKILHQGKENNYIIMQSLIFISITVAAAMMIVGNELARAFGLVGAVSVIRFRTAVKSYRDMAFVFLAIVIGMACGLQFYLLAVIVGVLTGTLMLVLGLLKFGQRGKSLKHYIIRVFYEDNHIKREEFESELSSHVISWKFLGLKANNRRKSFKYKISVYDYTKLDTLSLALRKLYGKNKIAINIDSIQ